MHVCYTSSTITVEDVATTMMMVLGYDVGKWGPYLGRQDPPDSRIPGIPGSEIFGMSSFLPSRA